jgi:hypothetical protein
MSQQKKNQEGGRGSKDLEAFLLVVEKEIIDKIFDKGNDY